jgi:hypothetical protein
LIQAVANIPCSNEPFRVFDDWEIIDFPNDVINGGGLRGAMMAGATPEKNPERVSELVKLFRAMNFRLLNTSKVVAKPPRQIADEGANRNYPAIIRHAYVRETMRSRIYKKLKARSLFPDFILENEVRARWDTTLRHLESLFI